MLTMQLAWRWPRERGRGCSGSAGRKEVQQGAWVRDGNIVFRDVRDQQREIMQVSEIPLKGAHNLENVLAAVCAGALMGCAPEKIRQAVRDFKAVEHRLEFVATIRGVDYYNDSKATNVDATIKALESFPANIHLILGGKDKGSDYTVLNDLLRQRVKRVYTIGAAAEKSSRKSFPRKTGALKSCMRRGWRTLCARRMPWRSRRRGPAGSRLRQLRSVQKLRAPRAGVQGDCARSDQKPVTLLRHRL